jgi:hypothetical protein
VLSTVEKNIRLTRARGEDRFVCFSYFADAFRFDCCLRSSRYSRIATEMHMGVPAKQRKRPRQGYQFSALSPCPNLSTREPTWRTASKPHPRCEYKDDGHARNNECIYPRPIFAACVPKRNRLGMIRDHASVGHGRTHGSLMLATTVTFDQVQGWRKRSNSVTEIMLVSSMSQVSAN